MLSIRAASKQRLATEGAGGNRPKKKAKPKRPIGTKFINYTCELDKDNCVKENGLCIAHNTSEGNPKVGCLVNAVDAQLTCGNAKIKVEMECDVCFHVFSSTLANVTNGRWCNMCSSKWKHCGVMTCTFCFDRSFAPYNGLTLNDKKKADCTVKKADLRLALSSSKQVEFKCDVCLHVFSMKLANVTSNGQWCGMCSNKWEHCGVVTCSFCFNRSIASYEGETSNDKKKADCMVNESDLCLALNSSKKVKFKCDVCLHPFSSRLADVTSYGSWCPCRKNKTATKIFKLLLKMKFEVVREYIPGGKCGRTSLMYKTYGKNGFMDYYLPGLNILFELDGAQHNMEVAYFKKSLFRRMISDKWKEFWARKYGLSVIRFDQPAILKDDYDWKQEMENILTFTSEQLTKQHKETEKRYKKYAEQHQKASKRMDIPDHVKISHQIANTPSNEYITKYVLAMKPFGNRDNKKIFKK
jgi:very-short-patch-repair endonuclease